MKNITTAFRACALLSIFGMLIMTSACGNSDSTSDSPSMSEEPSTPTPAVIESRTPPPSASVSDESIPSSTDEETTLEGELMKVEGSKYTMNDREGAEQIFNASADTLVDEGIEIGNRIIVKIGKDGKAIAIRKDR